MPLGLLALASSMREAGFIVKIYQPKLRLFKNDDFKNVALEILATRPKFVGFSTWCHSFSASLMVAEQIKRSNQKITVIFGGPQASIVPAAILSYFQFVDFVLSGEADNTLPQLLINLLNNQNNFSNIPGLTFRDGRKKVIQNKTNGIIENVNNLPVPAYDLVSNPETLKLDVGRGCPFKCTYCTTNIFFSKKYRIKSAERIISEMDLAYQKAKIMSFSFAHDMFTLNKGYIIDFCEKLKFHNTQTNRFYKWTCSARIDCVSKDLLIHMKSSGCQSIFFGIESGSNKIQNSIKKRIELNKVIEISDLCRQINMNMFASFIIGFPDESKEDIEETLQLIIKIACKGTFIQISELSVLPGTPIFTKYHNSLKFNGSFSNFSHAIIGKTERNFIKKYPLLFSSFYYLPVKSLSRNSIVILCKFINTLREFRNTLFLLDKQISQDIKKYNLLDIFLQNKTEIKKFLNNNNSLLSLLIFLFKKYIFAKFKNAIPQQISTVFRWEATQNLLKSNFLRWHLVSPELARRNTYIDFSKFEKGEFISTPTWYLFFSNFNLIELIPEKNNWKTKTTDLKKGNFYYLLTASSDKTCNIHLLEADEYKSLQLLQNNSRATFISQTITLFTPAKLNRWINKLVEFGVLR